LETLKLKVVAYLVKYQVFLDVEYALS